MTKLEILRELDYSYFFADVPSGHTVWPDAVGYALKYKPEIYDGRVSKVTSLINSKSESDVFSTVEMPFDQMGYSKSVLDPTITYIQKSAYTTQQEQFNGTLAGGLTMFLNMANTHGITADLKPLDLAGINIAVKRATKRKVLDLPKYK